MKNDQHKSRQAKCPYYHKHSGTQIYCDGLPEAVSTQIAFTMGEGRRAYMLAHCEREPDWQSCPWAQTLERIENDK